MKNAISLQFVLLLLCFMNVNMLSRIFAQRGISFSRRSNAVFILKTAQCKWLEVLSLYARLHSLTIFAWFECRCPAYCAPTATRWTQAIALFLIIPRIIFLTLFIASFLLINSKHSSQFFSCNYIPLRLPMLSLCLKFESKFIVL